MFSRKKEEGVELIAKADLDPGKYERYMQVLRDRQNFGAGLLGGIAAAAVGAILWAVVTYLTERQLGLMAIVLGALIGFAVLKAGKGVDIQFRLLGALLALLCCLAGNLLAACVFIAKQQGMTIPAVLSQLGLANILGFAKASFKEGDVMFSAIAAYAGFRWSARKLTQDDYAKISQMP